MPREGVGLRAAARGGQGRDRGPRPETRAAWSGRVVASRSGVSARRRATSGVPTGPPGPGCARSRRS